MGALEAQQIAMVAVLMISSVLNVAYLLPIPIRGFMSAAPGDTGDEQEAQGNPGPGKRAALREAPLPCVIAQSITAIGCVILFFYPDPVYRLLSGLIGP